MVFRMLEHWLSLTLYSWRAVGPRAIATKLLAYSIDAEARNSDSGFDARFGTDTTRELTPGEAALPVARRAGATMYLPSMDCDLGSMFDALCWPAARLCDTTFVDLGSGKGRAVFLAALRPLRQAIGVELSPVLHEIAQSNLEMMRASRELLAPVQFVLGDATAFAVPQGPLIVYVYHPFRESTAAKVIDRVVASIAGAPRPVAILYAHPTLQRCLDEDVFARGGLFQRVHTGARETRRFRIGWSIWTNEAWLAQLQAATSEPAAAAAGTTW